MTPKARKEKLGLGSPSVSFDRTCKNANSTEFSFKMSNHSSPDRKLWLNRELIVLMESKAILERGFLSLKQASSSIDAEDITSDTYVRLMVRLFETISDHRKAELREKLKEVLKDEEEDSETTLALPLKMKRRDTKILRKKFNLKNGSDKASRESPEWETITEHFHQKKSPMPSFERSRMSSSPKKTE